MSDIYDEIAHAVGGRTSYWDELSPIDFAAAFREHFAQRTCASCQHVETCAIRMDLDASFYSPDVLARVAPDRFSCSLWTAKPEAK